MKKMDNKGFSLVELVIVIAIMAILAVVLAPQFTKYVEQSRNSTDVSNATAIVNAIQVYAIDPATPSFVTELSTSTTAGTLVTVSSTGIAVEAVANGLNSAGVTNALAAAGIATTTTAKSKNTWTSYTINVLVAADGTISFVYDSSSTVSPDPFTASFN